MGGWKLEASRFALVIIFPVGAFWLFNQPDIFKRFMKGYKLPETKGNADMAAFMKQLNEQKKKEEYEKFLREQMAFEEARRQREALGL